MANTTPSPNMNMPVPNVGVDPSPQWATDINSCLSVIDGHNHSLGTGVQITPSGLNINADLPFLSNNATLLRSVRFAPQSSAISGAADLGCLYEAGVDLYYNDGSGNQIRITQAGSVTGASGTITGLPSGTASAAYAAGTFTFQSATNTAATIDAGSYIFRNLTASSYGITVSPPNAIGSNYNLQLPSIPGVTSIMTLDTSGNMAAVTTVDGTTVIISSNRIEVGTIQNANIAAGAVTGGSGGSIAASTITASNMNLLGKSLGGVQSYTSAGTYTWTVPSYPGQSTVFVMVQGMGGGGGGNQSGTSGPNGGNTSFNGVVISQGATGGYHGSGGAGSSGPVAFSYYTSGYNGTAGANSQDYSGGVGAGTAGGGAASDGGAGGAAGNPASSATGNGAGGGGYNNGSSLGGGGGGCVMKTQFFNLTAGASITVVVGAGGSSSGGSGGNGSDGLINIYY